MPTGDYDDIIRMSMKDVERDATREKRMEIYNTIAESLQYKDYDTAERQLNRLKDDPEFAGPMLKQIQELRRSSLMDKHWPQQSTPNTDPVWEDKSSPLVVIRDYLSKQFGR